MQTAIVTESLLLLLISVLLLLVFIKNKTLSFAGPSELTFLGFVVYIIIKSVLTNAFDISSTSYLLFVVLLYYGCKSFFTENINLCCSTILAVAAGMILLVYLIFAVYHCYFKNGQLTDFYMPNKSIFGVLLAAQMAFALPLFLYNKSRSVKLLRWPFITVFLGCLVLLLYTKGRAGWLGLLLVLVYIVYQHQAALRKKKIILYSATPLISLTFYLLFIYKPGSSGGRMVIYKIAAAMFNNNWLWGIGHGQFKVRYNEYQAAYFALHNIDSKEALLADNTFYAFNDFFQVAIENGVVAFLIFIAAIFLLIRQIKRTAINNANQHLLTASIACLICISTGSLFSYSLQIFPVTVQVILCLAIINSFSPQQSVLFIQSNKKITKAVLLSINILLLIHFSFYFEYSYKSNYAFELKRSGFKQAAKEQYADLSKCYIKDGGVWFQYAQELYYTNQLIKAKQIISVAKKYYCSNQVYKLAAAIENDLHNYEQAEKNYQTAVFMVPNKMMSRNDLLEYYLQRKDTANAIYWAGSVINMPVKIPSALTENIRVKAKAILSSLIKKQPAI